MSTLFKAPADFLGDAGLLPSFEPRGLALAKDGTLYVADLANARICKVTGDGKLSTLAGAKRSLFGSAPYGFADGVGAKARFESPEAIVVDDHGDLLVADSANNRIRRVTPLGEVKTYAGGEGGDRDGDLSSARFRGPGGLAFDGEGNLYVADTGNHRIRKIARDGTVTTVAGAAFKTGLPFADGPAMSARFYYPRALAVGPSGALYVVDAGNNCIRKLSPAGQVTTFAGKPGTGNRSFGEADGPGPKACFRLPIGIAVDADETVYVAEHSNHRIRRISREGLVSTLVGGKPGDADGSVSQATFFGPVSLVLDGNSRLLVGEQKNRRIRRVQL